MLKSDRARHIILGKGGSTIKSIIESCISHLETGELQQFHNLAIVPLLRHEDQGPAYLTLGQALAQSVLTITEIAEGGSVPELRVMNRGGLPVLLLDGEELAGAKQNRALNTTILLPEGSQTIIPVSCTEHGRWSYTSHEFTDSHTVMPSRIRTSKQTAVHASLRRERTFRSDQGAVWDEIAEMSARANSSSSTGAMRDVYQTRGADLHAYLEAFGWIERQVGLVVFINGRVAGLDIISRASAFEQLYAKLLHSYALDALLEQARVTASPSIEKAKRFLEEVTARPGEIYPSVGYGEDLRFQGERLVGSALVFQEVVVHTAFFRTMHRSRSEGAMFSSRRRRRFRS